MACAYRYPFGAWRALIGIFLTHDMRISVSGTGSCEKFANGFPLGIGMSHFWSWHRNESPEIARKQIVMHMVRDSVTAIPVAMDAFAPALGDGVGGGRECGCLPGARPRRGSCRPARPLRLGGGGSGVGVMPPPPPPSRRETLRRPGDCKEPSYETPEGVTSPARLPLAVRCWVVGTGNIVGSPARAT